MEIYKQGKTIIATETYNGITFRFDIPQSELPTNWYQFLQNKLQEAITAKKTELSSSKSDESGITLPVEPHLFTKIMWIRQYRNQLLKDSDFAMLPDAVVSDKTAWQTYRQQLRDLPKTWNLDDKPSIDLSNIYNFDDVATLPFPKPPE